MTDSDYSEQRIPDIVFAGEKRHHEQRALEKQCKRRLCCAWPGSLTPHADHHVGYLLHTLIEPPLMLSNFIKVPRCNPARFKWYIVSSLMFMATCGNLLPCAWVSQNSASVSHIPCARLIWRWWCS
ncbi:hypothetical protein BDV29DRAFT_33029 [Aspergillus leporis]|uniref:Uncharacterized protein n=1 Tax=Aspergillus leporis TaxID=41062 RepID=A0A5N5WTQ0_9EURO|nr:hypothetical protein BDV29DRAFT_33029 [Aspergillus leporis]